MDYFRKAKNYVLAKWFSFNIKQQILVLIFFVLALCILIFTFFQSSPNNFRKGSVFVIEKGTTLSQVASELESQNYIRSEFWFKVFVVVFGNSKGTIAGDYFFNESENVYKLTWRVVHGDFGLTLHKITIPEGFTNAQIAQLLQKQFLLFDIKTFMAKAESGKMFPDTYFFLQDVRAEEVIDRMKENFDIKMETLANEFATSTHPFDQVITMASILEEEARTEESRKMIADILWRRLSIGMLLQVDSATTTYKQKGLPSTPISNPGIDAIRDALHPIRNPYLYFLSDNSGTFYYAKDFEGHQKNRELHLHK